MNSKPFIIVTLLLGCAALLPAQNNNAFYWWNPPDDLDSIESSVSVPTNAKFKALVLVVEFPDDSTEYMQDSCRYPTWYDTLIAPDVSTALTDSNYIWSITNFIYTASWEKDTIIGDVNPGYDGEYIIAPHNWAYYLALPDSERVITLEEDIIAVSDSIIDYSEYDFYGDDDYVDFVFFVLPREPRPRAGALEGEGNIGFAGRDRQVQTDDGVTVCRCIRFGSTHSYYNDSVPELQITFDKSMHLMAHELGHSFDTEDGIRIKDYYEQSSPYNAYALSAGQGKYTVMQLGYVTKHAHLYSPWERIKLGWIEPTVIDTNSQHVRLIDFNTVPNSPTSPYWDSMLYKIPVAPSEYFLITNHQQTTHWEDDYGRYFYDSLDLGPHPDAKGVLIWHVIEDGDFDYGTQDMPSELRKWVDLECAEGLLNLKGSPDSLSEWGSDAGWDRIDRWCGYPVTDEDTIEAWEDWLADSVHGSSSHPNDFFKQGYRTAFHALTNPSSDAYIRPVSRIYGRRDSIVCEYPAGSHPAKSWSAATEYGYRQNVATHVSIEGIKNHPSPQYTGDIQLCIRRSRIWTDSIDAMDRTTQRKLIYDGDSTYRFIYPSKGYVYYTKSEDPSEYWETATLLGKGAWPALALDEDNKELLVWRDENDSVHYRCYETGVQPPPPWNVTLELTGTPGPVAIDFADSYNGKGGYEIPDGLPGHDATNGGGGSMPPLPDSVLDPMVHLAYITRDPTDNQDKLYYTYFHKHAADDADDNEECVDNNLDEDTTHITGASIELDPANGKVCIAYGVVKNDTAACYYCEKNISGWSDPHRFDESISTVSDEPLAPFIDISGDTIRLVFNANDSVYVTAKPCSVAHNAWDTTYFPLRVSQATGKNRYSQIAGTKIAWTNFPSSSGDTTVWAYDYEDSCLFQVDSVYGPNGYFCQIIKVDTSAAYMYQHGIFDGPKWAVYYRGPDGFGGNMESDGPAAAPIATGPVFKMAVSRNILRGTQLSVFTTDECELAVYDVTGRRVARIQVETKGKNKTIETPIDCQNWSSGVYFVRAVHQGDNKTDIRTEKVVLFR